MLFPFVSFFQLMDVQFFMGKSAFMSRSVLRLSLLATHRFISRGTTCQETPNLSFSHPQAWALGSPSLESLFQ